MSISAALMVAALAVLAVSGLAFFGARRREEAQNSALRQEMQSLVNAQSQAVTAQFAQLSQMVISQLAEITRQVQGGMASAGALATGAQKAVAEQLRASTDMLGTIRQQLGEVQMKSHELSDAARHIETVLGGAKTRGTLGEIALDRMLADALPPSTYETQFRFSTGEVVDAVVRLQDKLLPIDSKFPLDDYRRLAEIGEEARKGFSSTVRAHADSIARKYILPGEGTLDFALMFVPSEGVFYEILRSEDSKGLPLDDSCRSKGIVPVSPSTLFAHLKIIFLGLRGLQLEENVGRILESLSAVRKQVEGFGEVYEKLGTHLRNAQQSYSDADRRLVRTRDALDGALDQLAQGAPPAKTLEATSRD
jgi:DNA recombination protein RmuC